MFLGEVAVKDELLGNLHVRCAWQLETGKVIKFRLLDVPSLP